MTNNALNRPMIIWLWSGYILVLIMVLVGGITRLTGSGLSITEWNVVSGTLPPMNEQDWQLLFDKYRQSPEFQKINSDMDLQGFKFIFFWEYIHRLIGRIIGMVFLIPFVYFYIKGAINKPLLKRLWIIFVLGGLQGLAGWLMVKSGLIDNPHVSHYRLALHLILATTVMVVIYYTILQIQNTSKAISAGPNFSKWIHIAFVCLIIQVFYGAFTAGLKAGYLHNTYPLMGDSLIPDTLFRLPSFLSNFTENIFTVVFIHRWFGFFVLAIPVYAYAKAKQSNNEEEKKLSWILLVHISIQILLGILTILSSMNLWIALLHQLSGILLVSTFTYVVYKISPGKNSF